MDRDKEMMVQRLSAETTKDYASGGDDVHGG